MGRRKGKPGKSGQKKHTKGGNVPIDEVFSQMGDGDRQYISAIINGVEVNLGTLNVRMHFHKGVDCIACGAKGDHFKVQRSPGPPHITFSQWHLNLFAINADGQEVLMTKDHRYPKSKGGPDTIANLDPMCTTCNALKADKVD